MIYKAFKPDTSDPLSIFITAADNGVLGWGIAELASSFVVPTQPIALLTVSALLFAGVDQIGQNALMPGEEHSWFAGDFTDGSLVPSFGASEQR